MSELVGTTVEFAPRWPVVASMLALALGLGLLSARIGAAPALHAAQRWLHALAVLTWIAAGWLLGLRLLAAATALELAARAMLLVIATAATLPILRDVIAGLALCWEGRHRLGDDVRVDAIEGRIVAFGLRSAVLRDRDGTEITLPYRRLAGREVVRLSLARRDAVCEFDVALPDGERVDVLRRRLLDAAMFSPYAAPGRRPEVFAVADERGELRIRVRAFVFDRAHEQRYRGDILARVLSPADRG